MSQFDEEAVEILKTHVLELQTQKPKIDEAIKNLISMLIGKGLTTSSIDVIADESIPTFTPQEALACGKLFLKTISSLQLIDYVTWTTMREQTIDQLSFNRLDESIKYKSLHFLYTKIINSNVKSLKISKTFGKNYFLWNKLSFNIIKQSILSNDLISTEEIVLNNKISYNLMNYFLFQFEMSLAGNL